MFGLDGRKASIVGNANERSLAWDCAQAQGAVVAVAWLAGERR